MTESGLRKKLRKQGYGLCKSRKQTITADDYGGYMIVNLWNNTIEAGEKFNLSLEEVEAFANEDETNDTDETQA